MVGFFTDKSLRMIVDLAVRHPKLHGYGVLTFEDLMALPFGNLGRNFCLVSMFVLAYGAMVAYLLVVKDNVPDVLGLYGESFLEKEGIMLLTSLLIMLPLSFCRDISELACTSSLSVMADVVLVVIVCVFSPVGESVSAAGGMGKVVGRNWVNGGVFIGLGVLSTALACQQSSFLISGTLTDPTSRRWATVTGSSLFVATSLSLLFGVVGYLGFLDETEGDVLNNFDSGAFFVNAARALLSVTMFLTYPMEIFVARHVLSQLFFNGSLDNSTIDEKTGNVIPERKACFGLVGRREIVTMSLYTLSVVPALIVNDLGPVLSLTGSIGASGIAYIAPGLVYLGINGDDFVAWVTSSIAGASCEARSVAGAAGSVGGDVEILVAGDSAGDSTADPSSPPVGSGVEGAPTLLIPGGRPWWWYPLLMPVWVSIATRGARGCDDFLKHFDYKAVDQLSPLSRELHGGDENEGENLYVTGDDKDHDETIGPNRGDYIYSIVFIVFGVVAAFAGVFSNVYAQLNNITLAS